jgi:hypothetical protein
VPLNRISLENAILQPRGQPLRVVNRRRLERIAVAVVVHRALGVEVAGKEQVWTVSEATIAADDIKTVLDQADLARHKPFRAQPVVYELAGLLLMSDRRRNVAQSEHQCGHFVEIDGILERADVGRIDSVLVHCVHWATVLERVYVDLRSDLVAGRMTSCA